jgi:SAM-dependent methyltransferase
MTNQKTDKSGFNRKDHWEHIYSEKASTDVSWYQQHPQRSLELIKATGVDATARIIDIGGGASTLADFILAAGYENLSVLDISQTAIKQARARLGQYADKRADKVTWLEHDITEPDITGLVTDGLFDVWHDRAVFHFLTEPDDRARYVRTLSKALKPGGHVIIATFDLNGPTKCSGLDVERYSPETMSAALGETFNLVETSTEEHVTPGGSVQNFVYCRFVKR